MKTLTVCLLAVALVPNAFCYDDVADIERNQRARMQSDMMAAQARELARQAEAMEQANRLQQQQMEEARRRYADEIAARNTERRRAEQAEAQAIRAEEIRAIREANQVAALRSAEQERARKAAELEQAKAKFAEERRLFLASVPASTIENTDLSLVIETPKYKSEQAESERRVYKKYPALAVDGSPEQKAYHALMDEYWADRGAKRNIFFTATWPEILAERMMRSASQPDAANK